MSIKTRLSIALIAIVALFCCLQYAALAALVRPTFEELEVAEAEQEVDRVRGAFQAEVDELRALGQDAALWDYAYIPLRGGFTESYVEQVNASTREHLRLALVSVLDAQGRVLLRSTGAPAGGDGEALPAALSGHALQPGSRLLEPLVTGRPVDGVLVGEWGPLLICAQPLVEPGTGRALGVLLLARALDDALLASLQSQCRVPFEVTALGSAGAPPNVGALVDELVTSGNEVWDARDPDRLVGATLLRDVFNAPALLVRAAIPRRIAAQGQVAVQSALLATAGAGVALLIVLYALLHFGVVGPLTRFSRQALRVGRRDEIVPLLDLRRSDEIGSLSRRFAELLEQLDAYHDRLADASHQAGMSQVATNVLHDVGNMVNALSVSSSLVAERARRLPADDLAALSRAVSKRGEELPRWIAEDPVGRNLPRLIELLAQRLGEERRGIEGECERLTGRVQDVVAVIRSQQDLAGRSSRPAEVALDDLVRRAVEVVRPERHGVELLLGELCTDPVVAERHKLMQVLVNLLQNAVEAFEGTPAEGRRVTVTAHVADGRARLAVSDNACGIAPADLERIFRHGVTSKQRGHGFGLHSAANLATEMHGSLQAHSAGPGQGATFVLEFPVSRPEDEPRGALPSAPARRGAHALTAPDAELGPDASAQVDAGAASASLEPCPPLPAAKPAQGTRSSEV